MASNLSHTEQKSNNQPNGQKRSDKGAPARFRVFPPSSVKAIKLPDQLTIGKKNHAFVNETYDVLRSEFDIFYNPVKNMLYKRTKKGAEQFTQTDFNSVLLKAKNQYGKGVTEGVLSSLLNSKYRDEINPVLQFFEQQSEKYPRKPELIDQLIDTIKTDTRNANQLIKKWLTGFGALVDKNDLPPRLALVFTGKQNTGKTEWFRRLLPEQLRNEYFAESNLDKGKDDELLLCQNLLVLNDEWDGNTTKKDPERLKTLISKNTFDLRVPYGKTNEKFKRSAMIAGTSNPQEILNDPTGNTRIIPVNVLGVDHDAYNAIDKNHLFCEILNLYLEGNSYMLDQNDREVLNELSLYHTSANVNAEILQKYFEPINENESKFWLSDRKRIMYGRGFEFNTPGFELIDAYCTTDVLSMIQSVLPRYNESPVSLGRELSRFTTKKARIQNNEGRILNSAYLLKKSERFVEMQTQVINL